MTTGALIAGRIHAGSKPCRIIFIPMLGGNDGLNTVVPYRQELYYQLRPTLALYPHTLIRVTDSHGLHPALESFRSVWDQGFMTVLNNVGFQEPETTHHRAILKWRAGMLANRENPEWTTQPVSQYGSNNSLVDLAGLGFVGGINNSGPPPASYPKHAFGRQLQQVARTIKSGSSVSSYQASLSGFDTHVDQQRQHAAMLEVYATSVTALITDLRSTDHFKETVIVSYSEFGRTLQENTVGGTHHGGGNCLFLFGEKLKVPGIFNEARLSLTDHGGVPVTIDYRRVCASLERQWLGTSSTGTFEPLALF